MIEVIVQISCLYNNLLFPKSYGTTEIQFLRTI